MIQYIRAVDRAGLNKRLLDALEKLPNVALHFNHKLTGADFNKKIAWLEQQIPKRTDHAQNPTQDPQSQSSARATEISIDFDFLIGADGAHSAVRYHMMKYARLNYQQEYIDTLWCEFRIQPTASSDFAISPNHLHIWPAGSFMFIAIPSLDKSFTCTLFAPAVHFATLSSDPPENLPKFFNEYFPGVTPNLISHSELLDQFNSNPHLPLISITCSPHTYNSAAVILGDAAHAMVPFYGQGMNAGLEDVRVLFETLDAQSVYSPHITSVSDRAAARETALDAYTARRTPDAAAINHLALHNYEEMRSGVQSPLYKLRKWVEEAVSLWFPGSGWRTQYARVSFENMRYSDVEREVRMQGWVLMGVLGAGVLGVGGLSVAGVLRRG